MTRVHLFGYASPVGYAFRQNFLELSSSSPSNKHFSLSFYSRNNVELLNSSLFCDFNRPELFVNYISSEEDFYFVCFGPIWTFASFLEYLISHHPDVMSNLRGVIACSSSSILSKRFSFNKFDKSLFSRLSSAEDSVEKSAKKLNIFCRILRPSLIYGINSNYSDSNITILIKFMRALPLIVLPYSAGLRQPIHATQLSKVAFTQLLSFIDSSESVRQQLDRLSVGGDETLTYTQMLRSLQESLPQSDSARRCIILTVPDFVFRLCSVPVLFYSPKLFEALLRMSADLSGFTQSHSFDSSRPLRFPVSPFY